MNAEVILGPPGTGKTTALLREVEKALEAGVSPRSICYAAFTKKAATEALTRAMDKFNLTTKDLPYFRTLHSLAFAALGMRRFQMMGKDQIAEFGDIMGLRMTSSLNMDEGTVFGSAPGDIALFICNLARMTGKTLMEQWKENPEDLGWYEVERVDAGLRKFKQVRALYDFTDLLEKYCWHVTPPQLDLLVIDEAQDLSMLQWQMVGKMSEHSKRTIIAGDDDQAVFRWAGADVDEFIRRSKSSHEVRVLGTSYRVPEKIRALADTVIKRVSTRAEKTWKPRKEEGTVSYHTNLSTIDMSEGTWLILTRNSYLLADAEQQCRREGLLFSRGRFSSVSQKSLRAIQGWEALRQGEEVGYNTVSEILSLIRHNGKPRPKDGEFTMIEVVHNWDLNCAGSIWHEAFDKMSIFERSYLVAMRRRGEKVTKDPRIKLSTIHSAKGGEADNVVLYTDMARRTYNNFLKNMDDELRVFYVGITRAKKNLYIITSQTKYFFRYI